MKTYELSIRNLDNDVVDVNGVRYGIDTVYITVIATPVRSLHEIKPQALSIDSLELMQVSILDDSYFSLIEVKLGDLPKGTRQEIEDKVCELALKQAVNEPPERWEARL